MFSELHLLLLYTVAAARASEACDAALFSDAVDALARAVDYMDREFRNINLDGAVGCRMGADQLKFLLDIVPESLRSHDAYKPLLRKLLATQKKADAISTKASPYLQKSSPEYFKTLGQVIQPGRWNLRYPVRHLLREFQDDNPLNCHIIPFAEEESDYCLSELLGTSNGTKGKCNIPDVCWIFITAPGYKGYSLTHQLIYLEIAEMGGCASALNKRAPGEGFHVLQDYLCSNVMRDAERIAEQDFPYGQQDLFMEQIALCGMVGFIDFYRPQWLQNLIDWQRPEGCYDKPSEMHWTCYDQPIEVTERKRRKREEKTLKGSLNQSESNVSYGERASRKQFSALFEGVAKNQMEPDGEPDGDENLKVTKRLKVTVYHIKLQ